MHPSRRPPAGRAFLLNKQKEKFYPETIHKAQLYKNVQKCYTFNGTFMKYLGYVLY